MPAYYFVTTFNAINQCIGHYGNMGYQVCRRGIQNQMVFDLEIDFQCQILALFHYMSVHRIQ